MMVVIVTVIYFIAGYVLLNLAAAINDIIGNYPGCRDFVNESAFFTFTFWPIIILTIFIQNAAHYLPRIDKKIDFDLGNYFYEKLKNIFKK